MDEEREAAYWFIDAGWRYVSTLSCRTTVESVELRGRIIDLIEEVQRRHTLDYTPNKSLVAIYRQLKEDGDG